MLAFDSSTYKLLFLKISSRNSQWFRSYEHFKLKNWDAHGATPKLAKRFSRNTELICGSHDISRLGEPNWLKFWVKTRKMYPVCMTKPDFWFSFKKNTKIKNWRFFIWKNTKIFLSFFKINFSKIRLRHAHRNGLGSLHSKFELIWSSQSWDIVGPVFSNYQLQNGISPVFFDQMSPNLFCVLLKRYTLMPWNQV